jgi:hypothetical protein
MRVFRFLTAILALCVCSILTTGCGGDSTPVKTDVPDGTKPATVPAENGGPTVAPAPDLATKAPG